MDQQQGCSTTDASQRIDGCEQHASVCLCAVLRMHYLIAILLVSQQVKENASGRIVPGEMHLSIISLRQKRQGEPKKTFLDKNSESANALKKYRNKMQTTNAMLSYIPIPFQHGTVLHFASCLIIIRSDVGMHDCSVSDVVILFHALFAITTSTDFKF